MKRQYGLLLALLVVSGLTGCAPTTSQPATPVTPVPGNVAVLVVDDFGGTKDTTKIDKKTDDNCTVGANDVGSNGADDDPTPSAISHGARVYQVLSDALKRSLGSDPAISPVAAAPVPPNTFSEWSYQIAAGGPSQRVRLVAVHTDKYRTEDVLNGIKDQISDLQEIGFNYFVLNLSFVVIPCDVLRFLSDPDLNDLLTNYNYMISQDATGKLKTELQKLMLLDNGLLTPSRVKNAENFTGTVLQNSTLAPLRSYLVAAFYKKFEVTKFSLEQPAVRAVYLDLHWRDFIDRVIKPGKVIPVGAAGNGLKYPDLKKFPDPAEANTPSNLVRTGLPFPFAPALWDFVVSSTVDDVPEVTAHLNSGEVKLDGHGPALAPYSFGTSFAAPRLSALEAKYLAETGYVACGGTPPMGYVTSLDGSSYDLNTDSPWDNLGKNDWHTKCTSFPLP